MAKERGRTRRELLVSATARARQNDSTRLARLLTFEELAVEVYAVALADGQLAPAGQALAAEIRDQEESHAAALATQLHVHARRSPLTAAEMQRRLAAEGIRVVFADLRDERAWIGLLAAVENALEGAYYIAVKHLIDDDAALLAAKILANEAQHSSALSELRHPGRPALAAPEAMVEGSAAPPPP